MRFALCIPSIPEVRGDAIVHAFCTVHPLNPRGARGCDCPCILHCASPQSPGCEGMRLTMLWPRSAKHVVERDDIFPWFRLFGGEKMKSCCRRSCQQLAITLCNRMQREKRQQGHGGN